MPPWKASSRPWIAIGPMRRFNQGRAVPPGASALTTAVDLHEILSSETLAAKFNAQLVGQIIHDLGSDSTPAPGFSAPTDKPAATDKDAETVKRVTLEHLRNIGIRYQDMPEGVKMELLDTKRPNANMPQFVDFLTGLIGGTHGLARVYSTMKAQTSYTAFRGEQVMTWPSFEEAQKDLEREVCDWAARLAIARAVKRLGVHARLDVAEDARGLREGRAGRAREEAAERRDVHLARARAWRVRQAHGRAQAREEGI